VTAGALPQSLRRWRPQRVAAGDWTITALSDGFLRLDGGAMWGVVPANLWRKLTPPAPDNTILLALRPFLAQKGERNVLIEGGIGGRWAEKERRLYGIERPDTLASTLASLGLAPADVTDVVLSHAHFDHIGALVVEAERGLAPLFPRARHFLPEAEIAAARQGGSVRRASYRVEEVETLVESGRVVPYCAPLEGVELLPGVRAYDASGHSEGLALLTLNEGEGGEQALFWADVVPTTHHIQPPYIMAYDLDVVRSFENRSRWLARAAEERMLGMFYHDPEHAFGRLQREGKRYVCEPLPPEG
jgi:glyoxylase-like metal-dependent hydrolase (beta-lactamase superfamily II)